MFERVTIIGVGLLGASLGLALKERKLARHVVGVGRQGSPSLAVALQRGAIDESSCDIAAASAKSDLIVLCTPIRQFPESLKLIARTLRPGAIVTDVGSTKAQIMRWAARILPHSTRAPHGTTFIGSHPMAGSEKRGPEHARADLYQGALCLLCMKPKFRDQLFPTFQKVQALWQAVGMRTLRLGALQHDRWVATVSHLPHAVAFSLVNAVAAHPEMFPAIAGGFLDTTRIAASDVDMWTDIFLTNRMPVIDALGAMQYQLTKLKKAIIERDEPALRALLTHAKNTREQIQDRRHKP